MSRSELTAFDPLEAPLEGNHVIEASAGTGKTYNITFLFLRLIVERDLAVERVLVVTFTNLATAELRDEVRRRLRQVLEAIDSGNTTDDQLARYLERLGPDETKRARQKVRRALAEFDQAAIFSIHGFCQRMLKRSAFESGVAFDLELQTDQRPLCLEIASDFWAREVYSVSEPFADYLERTAKIDRDSLASLAVLASDKPDVEFLYGACTDQPIEPDLIAAFAAAQEAWGEGCVEARELLAPLGKSKILKRPYQGAKLGKLFETAGRFLEQPRLTTVACPKGLVALTPAGLADGIYAAKRKSHGPPDHPLFDALGALVEQLTRAAAVFANRARALERDLVEFTRRELTRRKRERRVQTFSDQLHDFDRALADPAGGDRLATEIRRRFDAALIDEFQDTNPVQYRIFKRLFHDGSTPLFMVGDPKQSIYAFRGGDVHAYLTAVREAGSRPYTLDVNWRADERLIRGVSALYSRVDDPFLSAEIGFPEVHPRPDARDRDVLEIDGEFPPPLQFLLDGGADDEAADDAAPGADEFARVAADIASLLDSEAYVVGRGASPDGGSRDREAERIVAGDIAVLLTANFQAPKLQAALRERGVASVLETDRSVFDTAEADELARLLEAIAEPTNSGRVRAALCTDLIGLSADEIWRMQDDDHAWEEWVVRMRAWRGIWTRQGLIQMLRSLMALPVGADRLPVQARVLGFPDGERRMTNLMHLGEMLHRQASDAQLGVAGLLRWLAQQRAGGGAAEAAELRLESDERAVKLLTVFKAKGLQYPVVYLPFFRRGKVFADGLSAISYHDADAGDEPRVDLGSEDFEQHRELAAREELAERLRVLYVALTRAQHLCRVVWGAFDGMENSALGYLLHRPPDRTEVAVAKAHVRALDSAAIASDLEAIAERSDGGIGFRPLGNGRYSRVATRAPAEALDLHCRSLEREVPAPWTSSSYSALIGSSRGHAPGPVDERGDARVSPAIPLRDFPAGADPGLFFHKVFEELDFGFDDPRILRRLVDRWLPRHGLDPRLGAPACDAVTAVLDTSIDSGVDLRMRGIPLDRRLEELPFVLPVAGGAGAGGAMLTPARLSASFREHGGERFAGYSAQLAELDFDALRGYLRGTADLVFEHRGKWYVLDYKSNHLGDRYSDYARANLDRPMEDHHYLLQYHLYTLAVHRLLRYRLPSYDYATRFGGVYYLFIRGMSPELGSECGVYFDRPRADLIDALDELMAGGEVGAP